MIKRMVFLYACMALCLAATINSQMAHLARVNYLQDEAVYVPIYLNHLASFDQKKFRLAKKYYQAFIGTIPYYMKFNFVEQSVTLSRAYAMIAICDYYLGDATQAIEYFNKAIRLEPKHFWLHYDLGVAYFKAGSYLKAQEHFKDSLAMTLKDLHANMELDYFEQWPKEMAKKYESLSTIIFYKMIKDSYKLSNLSEQLINNPKNLATIGPEFNKFDLIYNPSLVFLPIGQEKIFVGQGQGLLKIQNRRIVAQERN